MAVFANGDRRSYERSPIQLDCHWVSLLGLNRAMTRAPFPSNPTCDRRPAALCCRRRARAANRHELATSRCLSKPLAGEKRASRQSRANSKSKSPPLTQRLVVECPEQSVLLLMTPTRASGPGAQLFAHCSRFHDPAHVGVDQLFFVNASAIWASMAQASDHL